MHVIALAGMEQSQIGRFLRQKQGITLAFPAAIEDVILQSSHHSVCKRQFRRKSRLLLLHIQFVPGPVDICKPQMDDIRSTESKLRTQQNDCKIAFPLTVVRSICAKIRFTSSVDNGC